MSIARAVMQLKALEIAQQLNTPTTKFKTSLGWCKRMMWENGLSFSAEHVWSSVCLQTLMKS